MPSIKRPEDHILIWSGSKQVLQSGTVLAFPGVPTSFDAFVQDDRASVVFEFVNDRGETRADASIVNASTMRITYFNFQLGTFAVGPTRLGTIGSYSLWLAYEIHARSATTPKVITYTFWTGPLTDEPGAGLSGAKGNG